MCTTEAPDSSETPAAVNRARYWGSDTVVSAKVFFAGAARAFFARAA